MCMIPSAYSVYLTGDTITVELDDGRTISVPLAWYPRLQHATTEERENWQLVGGGHNSLPILPLSIYGEGDGG